MNKLQLLILIFLLPLFVSAQNCDCSTQFDFVRNHYEKNNPAFQKIKADSKAFKEYSTRVNKLTKKAKKELSAERCNIYLEDYVRLLKDHHSGIDINLKRLPLDFNSAQVLDSFRKTAAYRSFEVAKVDTTLLFSQLSSKSTSDVEGIYTNGGIITFALVKTKPNHYTGIALWKNKYMDVGHILLELEATKDASYFSGTYNTGLLGFNMQHLYQTIEVKNGKIPLYGFFKTGIVQEDDDTKYSFKSIDENTNYLKLKSFAYSLKDKLNNFYKTIDSAIISKPYLIIDLRDNGGGSEECYFNLLPYVYTKPFKIDDSEVWVTKDNIKQYENFQKRDEELIRRMKAAADYTFIPQGENSVSEWKISGTTPPKKVAILFNRHTASSAEGMITYCIQSSKVITLGENSGGFLGYGNVMTTSTPCGMFSLRSTTTRYKNNSRYEFIGIEPMIKLSADTDWIEAAKKVLQH